MKDKFFKYRKIIIPILIIGLILPILFFARDDIRNMVSAEPGNGEQIINPEEDPQKLKEPEIIEEEVEQEEEPVEEPKPETKPEPKPEAEPEPVEEEPEPESEPETKPEPKPEPEHEPEADPSPTIYAGQLLRIPGTSNGKPGGPSIVVREGRLTSSSKQIALTFDAGWLYDQTIELLDTLDAYNVKSTFFLRAQWAKDYPHLAREIVKRGHSVENHSLTHGHMREMTDSQVRNEIVQAKNIIKEVTGYTSYLFRPPYGEYDSRILRLLGQEGYTHTIMWTIDTHDWADELNGIRVSKDYIVNRVLDNASDKGIVLMHVGGKYTIDALAEMIGGLRNAGYSLVKVNDMLPEPGPSSSGETLYSVERGDTLYGISRKFNVSIDDIIKVNGL